METVDQGPKENRMDTPLEPQSRRNRLIIGITLGLIILLGAFLRFYELGATSIGNSYYAATVQSMLTSWKNFFFGSFEPGGSVTVDKPPLGFWIQAVSAYFLGVNGFALALPQALAGVLSIPLLYAIVKRQFGVGAGLIAALVLAVMPVSIATERNNTIDGMLLFVLLVAAWAFIRSVRGGQFRYLLLGATLVGLGFNIKMLQAFLPLPAFYALYLLGAPHRWWVRIIHLGGATALLIVVSLSWAIVVDLIPAEERPYIGSSENNSVLELVMGHNGIRRITSSGGPGPQSVAGLPDGNAFAGDARPRPLSGGLPLGAPPLVGGNQQGQLPRNPPPPPGGGLQDGGEGYRPTFQPYAGDQPNAPPPADGNGNLRPPNSSQPPGGPQGDQRPGRPNPGQGPGDGGPGDAGPGGRGPGRSSEVGEAGALRLFTQPLADEASWLLPFVLLGLPLIIIVLGRPWPLSEKHLALVLWGGWLIPEVLYFTFTTGLFHAYYLIMLAPPLAALVGATAWALGQIYRKRRWLGMVLIGLLAAVTLAFQIVTLNGFPDYVAWAPQLAILLGLLGLGLLIWQSRRRLVMLATLMLVAALALIPMTWSGITTFDLNPNVGLPNAGPSDGNVPRSSSADQLSEEQEWILDYLLANTDPDGYLVAAVSSHVAAPYILATQRPVLTMGGFNGRDEVITADELSQMVADGELRFVLGGGDLIRQKPEIYSWVQQKCRTVNIPGTGQVGSLGGQPPGPQGGRQETVLYDCGSQTAQQGDL